MRIREGERYSVVEGEQEKQYAAGEKMQQEKKNRREEGNREERKVREKMQGSKRENEGMKQEKKKNVLGEILALGKIFICHHLGI